MIDEVTDREKPSLLISRANAAAGIGCGEESNVTIQAVEFGSLSVTGRGDAAGIRANADESDSCSSMTIVNRSVSGTGGTGLGSGRGQNGHSSRVETLTIHGGEIRATGTNYGSGLGSGCGYGGNSEVVNRSLTLASRVARAK
jgi:hypothetical protein